MKLLDEKIQEVLRDHKTNIRIREIPEEWPHSYLQLLPKPRKDAAQLSSYRIKTMQNVYKKLLKKIIAWKLTEHLEDGNIPPNTMGSCKPATTMTNGNAGTYEWNIFERFQHKMLLADEGLLPKRSPLLFS